MEAQKEHEWEAHFYLIKTLLFVVTGVPDASAANPYKASRSTPDHILYAHTSTHRPCHTDDSQKGFADVLFLRCLPCRCGVETGSLC